MRFPVTLAVAGLALFTACHSSSNATTAADDASVLMSNDFEHNIGWGDADAASLTSEKAHGGRWSVRVKPEVEFGYTFSRLLSELSPTPLTHLVLEGWVLRVAPGSTAKLVVQVNTSATDDTKVFYTAFPIETAVPKFGEWTAVSVPITLPTTAAGTNKIKVYLWNNQGTAATYIDDVALRIAK